MKMKKAIISLLLILVLLAATPVGAQDRKLTLDRAVQISDTEIVLEFSEPIAINLFTESSGPFMGVRIVAKHGGVKRIDDLNSEYNGKYMQWTGTYVYLDNRHDRVLWTINTDAIGVNTLSEIRNYEGELSKYSQFQIAMVVEEVPHDKTAKVTDNQVCNITTADGEVYLTADLPTGWEKCILPIEVDYQYALDRSATEGVWENTNKVTVDYSLIEKGSGVQQSADGQEPVVQPTLVLRNDPIVVALLLGGGGLVVAALIITAILVRKKRKAV